MTLVDDERVLGVVRVTAEDFWSSRLLAATWCPQRVS